jgi:hypothetical protein
LSPLSKGGGGNLRKVQDAANFIRSVGEFRWVGIYDVSGGTVSNLACSGPEAPAHPVFPVSQGLAN